MHLVYPLLLGANRGRYFLLAGQELSARQALELAEQLLRHPPLTLRHAREVLALELKRLLQDFLGYGLALEGLAAIDAPPQE